MRSAAGIPVLPAQAVAKAKGGEDVKHFLCTRERVVHSPTRGDGQGASRKSTRGPRETDGPRI